MKRIITGVILATAVASAFSATTYAANAVPAKKTAAPVVKKAVAPLATSKLTVNIDGNEVVVSSIHVNGKNLVSVKELSKSLGASVNWNAKTKNVELTKEGMVVSFNGNSKVLTTKEKSVELTVAPKNVNGSMYLEVSALVKAFGGAAEYDAATKKVIVQMVKLLDGSNGLPRWIDENRVVVTRATDEKKVDYIINVASKKYETVAAEDQAAAEVVVSPDGTKAAYINDDSQIFVVDLTTKQVTKVGEDTSIKSELQWSAQGDKLYFIQGDKMNVIAAINLADAKITKLVDDKVNYKADLRVKADGKAVLYTVTKDGKITADSPKEDDQASVENAKVEIDIKGTEPQLFVADVTQKEIKPVQLTKSSDNKVFGSILADGRVLYVSVDVEKENALPVLKVISADGKETKDLVADMGIYQVSVAGESSIYVLAADKSGKKAIYTVDVNTGTAKKSADVSDDATQMFVSANGKQIAVTMDTEMGEKVAVLSGSKFVQITK